MVGTGAVLVVSAVAIGTLLVAGLALYASYNATVPAATEFRNLEVACVLWGTSELVIYLAPSAREVIENLYTVRLFFSGLTGILAIIFVAEYTQSALLTRPEVRRLLWSGLGVVVMLWILNPRELAYSEIAVDSFQGINTVSPAFGPGLVAYFLFIYVFYLITFGILGLFALDSTNVYREQTALILGSFAVVVLGTVASLLGITPGDGIDLGLVFNALGGAIIWAAIYQYEFLTVVPLARESIIDTVTDPVLVFDEAERLIYSNAAAGAVRVDEDDRNTPASDLVPGLQAALADGEVIVSHDNARERERVFEPVSERLADHHGRERGQVVVMREVTERHRREQRLDEFASIVSHDLRNPLNVASLRIGRAKDTGNIDDLDAAQDALDRMEELIEDLLTISQTGYADAETEATPLAQTARAAWSTVDTGESTLEVATNTTLVANRSQLRELFENLFRNAVEHNERPVTVRVDTRQAGFVVADDGDGISEDQRDELFDPGTSTADDGTGFGLYIVRQIADAHGWTVTVADSDDGGVRFVFSTGDSSSPE